MTHILHKLFACFIFTLIASISLNAQPAKKTQVLVLGTMHLEQTENVQEKDVSRVVDSLMQYHFDAIAVEQMSPELLLDMNSRTEQYWKDLISNFQSTITTGAHYQDLYHTDYGNAKIIIDSLLAKDKLTEADRIEFMKASLCAYDVWSASLQYQFISDKKSIDSATVALMNDYTNSLNEINLIGIHLAQKSNIRKLYPIDNMQDETILIHDFPEFIPDYQASQDKLSLIMSSPFYHKVDSIQSRGVSTGDLYYAYKFLNSNEYMIGDKKGQWDIWFETDFKSKSDRSRYSLWEMRNLQIAANIMRLVAAYPEKKILVIIGSSHKSFIESYLKQMSDVEVLTF